MPRDFASFKPIVDLLNIQVPESNQSKEAGKLESYHCDKVTHTLLKIFLVELINLLRHQDKRRMLWRLLHT